MKRMLDIVGAAFGVCVFAIPMAVIATLVRVQMGSPVLHRATRPGLGGRPFVMLKFRTMREAYDANGRALPDQVRITPLGRFLRRTSLDELPELVNVLKGEMSLVGPRPLLMEYIERYTPEQARRHDVLPGITGWAQINGRNTRSWDEKLALDVWYVDRASVLLDVKILARTIGQVVRRANVSADGDLDVPRFFGSSSETIARGQMSYRFSAAPDERRDR